MYSKLPLKFVGITDKFGLRTHPITGVSTYHYGVDFGWNKYQGEPVLASHDAKVVYEGYDSAAGNHVVLKYTEDKKTIINRYLHLKNRAIVKKGQKVSQGEVLGYMGNTGNSTAVHLHFEYWICPSNYSYKALDVSKYAKNPLNYCYLFDDQSASSSSISKVKKVIGFGTSKDESKNQIRITGKYLNCRSLPSLNGEVLGYINLGYYNILETKESDGYVWYRVGTNRWVAYVESVVERYLIDNKQDDNSTTEDDNVENNEINTDDSNDTNDSNENNNIDNNQSEENLSNYNKFVSTKDDYYYIYLKKGEIIYFPK